MKQFPQIYLLLILTLLLIACTPSADNAITISTDDQWEAITGVEVFDNYGSPRDAIGEMMCAEFNQAFLVEDGNNAEQLRNHLTETTHLFINDALVPHAFGEGYAILHERHDSDGNFVSSYGHWSLCYDIMGWSIGTHTARMEITTISGREYVETWDIVVETWFR